MEQKIKLDVTNDGYVVHKSKTRKATERSWYLGKPNMGIRIEHLPAHYWGKHIRIKIEVIDLGEGDDETESDNS